MAINSVGSSSQVTPAKETTKTQARQSQPKRAPHKPLRPEDTVKLKDSNKTANDNH